MGIWIGLKPDATISEYGPAEIMGFGLGDFVSKEVAGTDPIQI